MSLRLEPLTFREAADFVKKVHRHHSPPVGYKFAIGANLDGKRVAVVMVGRPVARANQDGFTAEVTRLASDGTKNACSFLYAAAWRAARAMGYLRMGTYIRSDEPGTSLKAAGWKEHHKTRGKSWDMPGRPRKDKTEVIDRTFYLVSADITPVNKESNREAD